MAAALIPTNSCRWEYDSTSQIWTSSSNCDPGYGCVNTASTGKASKPVTTSAGETKVADVDMQAAITDYSSNHPASTPYTVKTDAGGTSYIDMPCQKLP